MKVLAARRRDEDDLRVLIADLGLETPAQVLALCEDVFPDEAVPDRARFLIEDILARP